MDDTEEQWQKWLTSGYPAGTSERLAAPPELSANQQSATVDQSQVDPLHQAVANKREMSSSKSMPEESPPLSRLTLQSTDSSHSLLVVAAEPSASIIAAKPEAIRVAAEPAASSHPSYQKPSPGRKCLFCYMYNCISYELLMVSQNCIVSTLEKLKNSTA